MSDNEPLSALAKKLDLSVEYVRTLFNFKKGQISGIKGKTGADVVREIGGNLCASIAAYTGYKNKASATKHIMRDIRKFYDTSRGWASKIYDLIKKHSKFYTPQQKKLLYQAAAAMQANDFGTYNRLIKSDKRLKKYIRKCAKTVKSKMLDDYRNGNKVGKGAIRELLVAYGSKDGKKIIVPHTAITKEKDKRLKNYSNTASLFWTAAKKVNPKFRGVSGLAASGHIVPEKKKNVKKFKPGMSIGYEPTEKGFTVTVTHIAEEVNQSFRRKLEMAISKQEKFWINHLEKRLMAVDYLQKFLGD